MTLVDKLYCQFHSLNYDASEGEGSSNERFTLSMPMLSFSFEVLSPLDRGVTPAQQGRNWPMKGRSLRTWSSNSSATAQEISWSLGHDFNSFSGILHTTALNAFTWIGRMRNAQKHGNGKDEHFDRITVLNRRAVRAMPSSRLSHKLHFGFKSAHVFGSWPPST